MAERSVTVDLQPNVLSRTAQSEITVDRFQLRVASQMAGYLDMITLPDKPAVVVPYVAVGGSYRRHGYGNLLLYTLEQHLVSNNLTGILMNAIPTTSPKDLQTIYDRRGWQPIQGSAFWYSFNSRGTDQQTLQGLVRESIPLVREYERRTNVQGFH